jgi:hypothetical protein
MAERRIVKIVSPYDLKPGDQFRFADQKTSVYVFTGIRKNYSTGKLTDVMYAQQLVPWDLWCWWDLSADPDFCKILKIEL